MLIIDEKHLARYMIYRDHVRLSTNRETILKEIYSNLTRWQRVQLARHPQRPLSLDYINYMASDFIELHGDRYFGDDKAVICGSGTVNHEKVVIIGQQKGQNTKDNLLRNQYDLTNRRL